jgi:hypothetical protein
VYARPSLDLGPLSRTAWEPGGGRGTSLAGPLGAGLVGLIVYARTAMPGVAFSDWGEMQTVPHVLGVSHPTGYPTYILLAWAAQLVPVGSVAFRENLLSAVLVAAVLAVVAAILQHLDVRPLIAFGAALALGAVGTVWAAATVAEVNALHLFLISLLILFALRWAHRRATRDILLGGLVLGLSLGNHLLTLFVAPFLVLFVLWAGRGEVRKRPALLLATIVAVLAGLLVYLYVPLAALQSPPLAYNHPVTLDGVLWLATGQQFRYQFDLFSPKGPGDFVTNLPNLVSVMGARATPVLPVLGLVGLPVLVRRRPAAGLALLGIFLTGIYVWATYQRLEHYLLVPFLVLTLSAAVALDAAMHVVARRRRRFGRDERVMAVGFVAGVAAVAFAAALAAVNWGAADRSADHSGEQYVDAVFGALPPDAAILSYWDPSTPLWYAQHVEGRRPDVLIVDDSNIVYEHWGDVPNRIASLICERPVFVMRVGESDLVPIQARWTVTPFLTVRSSALGPSAAIDQVIFRVERPASGC